mmetsp:Transcript_33074/g.83131  ORF Transcript_33074/g.83131 Transcript_33074/m.83131 type:complete len:126 (+) Transcript_33074:3-380(+)
MGCLSAGFLFPPCEAMPADKQPIRLFAKGTLLGYRRSQANQYPDVSLVQIEGLKDRKDVHFYLGKRVAYVARVTRPRKGRKFAVTWGRITKAHGNSGVVRAKFSKNLPPKTMGASVRVMLYPSKI